MIKLGDGRQAITEAEHERYRCYVPNYLRLPRPIDSGIFKGVFRHTPLTIARQRQA